MKTGLAHNIANIKPGGNWVVPRNTIYGNIERAVETAEMRTGRLFKIVRRNDDWTVEDVTGNPGVRASRRHFSGSSNIGGSVRSVLTRSVIDEVGGIDEARRLFAKYLKKP